VLRFLYSFLNNYGWAIILFTFLVRLIMFPLALKQQKSTARNAAFQPLIKEIQQKWANDRNRQNQEIQKFQQENNMKMSAGCLPAIVNMVVLFGVIALIQAPLTYIVQLPPTEVDAGMVIVEQLKPELEIRANAYTSESVLIGQIKADPDLFVEGVTVTAEDGTTSTLNMGQDSVDAVLDFQFQFLGMDLSMAPDFSNWFTLIMPILSVITSLASQMLIMLTSGQTGSKMQSILMTVVFTAMFGFFAFRVPSGFSLYYTASSVVMTIQQLIVRKIHDPKKIAEEVKAEIEERKKNKKAKKQVIIKDETGQTITKDMTEAEINKIRLEQARAMDAQRYADEEPTDDAAREATELARALDEERYGPGRSTRRKAIEAAKPQQEAAAEAPVAEPAPPKPKKKKPKQTMEDEFLEDVIATMEEAPGFGGEEAPDDADYGEDTADKTGDDAAPKTSKPGRRRRARLNKEGQEGSFVQSEMAQEKQQAEETAEAPVKKEDDNA